MPPGCEIGTTRPLADETPADRAPAEAPADAPAVLPRLVLVRHAPTAWSGVRYSGRSDPPLTDAGRTMAGDLARTLAARLPWRGQAEVRMRTSPRERARSTAAPIATALGVPVEPDEGWAEVDMGRADGWTWPELETREPALAARLAAGEWDIDWPDGETAAAFRDRVAGALDALLADPRPAVVVSHAGAIRLAVALATGRDPAAVPSVEPGGVVPLDAAALVLPVRSG